ncbi:ATP-binding protein [Streptomyces heilongjiangensis]|uniref:ATP-binding protein n=1 Tax=Streptomyces heilongjiangensis TaxID=945052 RepID=A0ABW1BHH0_9ACTN|nr:ATP-binding protein [Streptomyces heilongjiangensis]MDC2952128.1 ATP-binding protein [Streptomyces heilongjiangensis]
MVIPLRKQAADEQGTDEHLTLRSGATWATGAARAADARCLLRTLLAHSLHTGRTPVPAPLARDAELVVSELVTNALRHAPGPCGLVLRLSEEALTITVWDTSPSHPTVRDGDRYRVGGHGLRLVHTVSDHVAVTPHGRGKQITAHLRLPRRPGIGADPDRPVAPVPLFGAA